MILHIFMLNVLSKMALQDGLAKEGLRLGKPILRLCCPILRLGNMDDSKFGLPNLKIGAQTWNSKFGLPNLKIGQIPSLGTTDTPLSIIRKHIPRQYDIDKIVKNIETCVIHSLELPIQAQDLVKVYQHSTHFRDIYQYITDGQLPSSVKVQNCIRAEALNYVVINNFLFRIDMQKDRDLDKGNLFLLVIPEKYEPIIFNTYHDSLLAGHQGPYRTAMTIRQRFFIHNLMNKVKRYIEACHTCLKTKPKYMKNRPMYGRIPVDYAPMQGYCSRMLMIS